MKKIIAIFIFIGVLCQSFSKVLIVADYYLNQNYIAQHFCENKDRPQLHCNGKCYLKKELQHDQQDKDIPLSQSQLEKFNITLFAEKYSFDFSPCFEYLQKQKFLSFQEGLIKGSHKNIFHPPPFTT